MNTKSENVKMVKNKKSLTKPSLRIEAFPLFEFYKMKKKKKTEKALVLNEKFPLLRSALTLTNEHEK